MPILRQLLMIIGPILVSGCVQPPLIVGQQRAPIAPEDVVVYFIDRPTCNFETVAWLQVEGGYLSVNSMLAKMRSDAAGLGASGLYVLQTQRSEMKEFSGSARAIRCRAA